MASRNKITIREFCEEVERQLVACSADQLRQVLRTMAREVAPADRKAFIRQLAASAFVPLPDALPARDSDMPAEITGLLEDLQSAMADSRDCRPEYGNDGYDDYYDDEDSLGPYEDFADHVAGLFGDANDAFDAGNAALARRAYEKLAEVFELEDDYGRGICFDDLSGIDLRETTARCLRAVYETEGEARRAEVLFRQFGTVSTWQGQFRPTLKDILHVSPKPLPDRDAFLPKWIGFLRRHDTPAADALLREATALAQGIEGLKKLARTEGPKRPRVYLDLMGELASAGRLDELVATARAALRALPEHLPIRAAIADCMCAAAGSLGDHETVAVGRWEAFLAKPRLHSLIELREAFSGRTERRTVMTKAAAHIQRLMGGPSDHAPATFEPRHHLDDLERAVIVEPPLLAHAYLMNEQWESALDLVEHRNVLGWSGPSCAQGLVFGAMTVCLSGLRVGSLTHHIGELWLAVLNPTTGYWCDPANRRTDLTRQLCDCYSQVLASASFGADEAKRALPWVIQIAEQRVDAIVGNKYRGSYDKAAMLIAACAELLQLRGSHDEARAFVSRHRDRYHRHSRFQAELKSALAQMQQPIAIQ